MRAFHGSGLQAGDGFQGAERFVDKDSQAFSPGSAGRGAHRVRPEGGWR
jgi:hypothetical protein